MGEFETFSDFLAMGGYAAYVWSAFAATFFCLGLLTFHTFYVRKKLRSEALKQLARLERIEKARAARKNKGAVAGSSGETN